MKHAEIRGRVVTAMGDSAIVRDSLGERHQAPAGESAVGDWVVVRDGECSVVSRPLRFGAGTGRLHNRTDHFRTLRARSAVLRAVREFFHERSFIEIEPSLRVEHPGLEVHIDAVEASGCYLISSPEYQMKRLLAEGHEKIFAICRCFRAGEEGGEHSTEFSMLEWYRSFADIAEIRRDTEDLIADVVAQIRGSASLAVRGEEISLAPPFDIVTVPELFRQLVGCDLSGDEEEGELADLLRLAGVDLGTATHWDDMFYTAFLNRVEPTLALWPQPVFVVDWPVRLGALARQKPDNPALVERFELYIGGLELANAFGELADPVEQRRRFDIERAERQERGKPTYGVDERFLAALDHGIPPSAGIALGLDRLVMLATGAGHIAEVQAFGDGEV